MPGISTQHSVRVESQHDGSYAQSIEDSFGLAFDENLTFVDAFQSFQQDSFLPFGGDKEDHTML
jgi:hypothetical protein